MNRINLLILLVTFHLLAYGQSDTPTIIHVFPNGYKMAKKNSLFGILTERNEVVYPFALYDSYKNLKNDLWRIKQQYPDTVASTYEPGWSAITRMKYGLISSLTGKIIFLPVYNYIEPLSNDHLLVSKDSLFGLMDAKTLKYILPPAYRRIELLKTGNYIVVKKDTLYFLNDNYIPINKYTNLTRFEHTLEDCVFIFRTSTSEGLSDCQGNKFSYPNWQEVLDFENGLVFVKTTDRHLAVYNAWTKKKIIEEPYNNFRLKDNKIYVYFKETTTLYDLTGKKLQ